MLDLSYRLFYINNDLGNAYGLTPASAIVPIGLIGSYFDCRNKLGSFCCMVESFNNRGSSALSEL